MKATHSARFALQTLLLVAIGILLFLLCGVAPTQAQVHYWTAVYNDRYDNSVSEIGLDQHGNLYVAGAVLDEDNGPSGGADGLLLKYSAAGSLLWAEEYGSIEYEFGHGLAVDSDGRPYLTGHTWENYQNSSGTYADGYLAKYDVDGSLLWERRISGQHPVAGDYVLDNSLDAVSSGESGTFVTGVTFSDIHGYGDAFLTKFDLEGNQLWQRQIGTSLEDTGIAVGADADGNGYVLGEYNHKASLLDQGTNDAFLAKYDSLGNEVWFNLISAGNQSREVARGLAVDTNGESYISRIRQDGASTYLLEKFDSSGQQLWSTNVGETSLGWITSGITLQSGGGVLLGHVGGVSSWSPEGTLRWTYPTRDSPAGAFRVNSVATDEAGNIYAAGSGADRDIVLTKFSPVPEPSTACLAVAGVCFVACLRRLSL